MDRISLPINTRFEKIEQINSEFTRCKCYIMALGKNRNGSHIGREAVEDALATFKNIPVIAFLYEGEDGNMHVAGHEMKLVENESGYEFRTRCVPYGVVPDCEFTFEEVQETDGTTATYLTGEVILWSGKYPEIMDAAYDNKVFFNQSMEIKVLDTAEFSEDSAYTDIVKFNASALCLLGKSDEDEYNVTPCFPSSSVVPFSLDDEFTQMMDEFKFALSESLKANIKGEIPEETLEDLTEGVVLIKNEIELHSDEVIVADEAFEEVDEEIVEPSKFEALFSSYNQKREMIDRALHGLRIDDDENEHYKHLWAMDFDDTYIYVEYHERTKDDVKDGHGRIAYELNEDEQIVYLTGELEEMFLKWLTASDLEAIGREREDFEAYKASHSTSNDEVDALREFKEARLAEDHRIEVENILSQFEDLENIEEFEELKQNALNYSDLNELENQCYAIRGRTVRVNFSAKPKNNPIPIVNNIPYKQSADDVYGGLFSMYGYKKD